MAPRGNAGGATLPPGVEFVPFPEPHMRALLVLHTRLNERRSPLGALGGRVMQPTFALERPMPFPVRLGMRRPNLAEIRRELHNGFRHG